MFEELFNQDRMYENSEELEIITNSSSEYNLLNTDTFQGEIKEIMLPNSEIPVNSNFDIFQGEIKEIMLPNSEIPINSNFDIFHKIILESAVLSNTLTLANSDTFQEVFSLSVEPLIIPSSVESTTSFLIKPNVRKGHSTTVTLVKSKLALVPKLANSFFSDITNWKILSFQFKNSHGQQKVLTFDASQDTPSAIFKVTEKARSDYKIKKIIISDLDDGTIVIRRSDLSNLMLPEIDVSFETITPPTYYTYNVFDANVATTAIGGVSLLSGGVGLANRDIPFDGDFDISFIFSGAVTGNDSYFTMHNTSGAAGFRFYNGTVHTYFNSNQQEVVPNNSTGNVYRIKRTGSMVEFYANKVKTNQNTALNGSALIHVRAYNTFNLQRTEATLIT